MNWELWDRMRPGNSIAHQQRLSNRYQCNRKCTGITWKTTKQSFQSKSMKMNLSLLLTIVYEHALFVIFWNTIKLVFSTTLCSYFCNEYAVCCTCKCMFVQMFVSWYMYFDSWLVHCSQCFITRVWWIFNNKLF